MRIKIDENLPVDAAMFLRNQGHDAQTVTEQGMGGHPDENVALVVPAKAVPC